MWVRCWSGHEAERRRLYVGDAVAVPGAVTVSREAADRVLVCFVPNGGSRFCPSTHKFNHADAVVNRWYYSSSFSFTVTDADAATARGRCHTRTPAPDSTPCSGPSTGVDRWGCQHSGVLSE